MHPPTPSSESISSLLPRKLTPRICAPWHQTPIKPAQTQSNWIKPNQTNSPQKNSGLIARSVYKFRTLFTFSTPFPTIRRDDPGCSIGPDKGESWIIEEKTFPTFTLRFPQLQPAHSKN